MVTNYLNPHLADVKLFAELIQLSKGTLVVSDKFRADEQAPQEALQIIPRLL